VKTVTVIPSRRTFLTFYQSSHMKMVIDQKNRYGKNMKMETEMVLLLYRSFLYLPYFCGNFVSYNMVITIFLNISIRLVST
jgi:hypothetical protein